MLLRAARAAVPQNFRRGSARVTVTTYRTATSAVHIAGPLQIGAAALPRFPWMDRQPRAPVATPKPKPDAIADHFCAGATDRRNPMSSQLRNY
jgi:hypothetical protein